MSLRVKQLEVTESIQLVATDTSVAVGDVTEWMVPATYDSKDLVEVEFGVFVAGVGNSTFQIRRKKLSDDSEVNLLTTVATVEGSERHTSTATTPPVISGAENTLLKGDILIFEVVSVGGTSPLGLFAALSMRSS